MHSQAGLTRPCSRRQLIDGIRWRIRTGAPWRDVPACYGRWFSVYGLLRRWSGRGLGADPGGVAGVCGRRREDRDGERGLDDHPGSPARGRSPPGRPPAEGAARRGAQREGRSRAGALTRRADHQTHLACEQGRKPLAAVVTAEQRGDSPQFIPVLGKIRVARLGGGRPRTRPDRVLADTRCHT
jgi:hypothetical protein